MSVEQDRVALNLAAVESHFHAEDSHSVEAALAAFTDDCIWEAPNPRGLNRRIQGKAALKPFYKQLFSTMKQVDFPICYERFATPTRVVDDSICTFEVAAAGIWEYPVGTPVFMRIVHLFEMRDGKIARETVFEMRQPVRDRAALEALVDQARTGPWTPGRMTCIQEGVA